MSLIQKIYLIGEIIWLHEASKSFLIDIAFDSTSETYHPHDGRMEEKGQSMAAIPMSLSLVKGLPPVFNRVALVAINIAHINSISK